MLGQGLPVSRLINVSTTLSALPAQAPVIDTLLLVGPSPVINTAEGMRSYASIAEVGTDFSVLTPEYQGAVVWFSQRPQPTILYIGRWAQTATPGQLIGGPLTGAEQVLGLWTAITNGGVTVTIDGTAHNLTGLNFNAVGSLNGVAGLIATALSGAMACVWNASYARFEFTSETTGAMSSVSFLSAPVTGTDLSVLLAGTVGEEAYQVSGLPVEPLLAAVIRLDQMFSTIWYGLVAPTGTISDHEAAAAYVEAANPPHYYGITTQDGTTLNTAETTSLAYLLSSGSYNKTAIQYSSSNQYAILSYLARILTTQWGGSNTAIDLMWKQEPGITAELLNTTQANALQSKNCNVLAAFANNTQLIVYGNSCDGTPTDLVIGADAWAADMQTTLFNLQYTAQTKVPQTDAGMTQFANSCDASSERFVTNGYLGPGVWNTTGFGTLVEGGFLANGYYVFIPPLATQSEASRAARATPLIQVAGKSAGAVRTVNVLLSINP